MKALSFTLGGTSGFFKKPDVSNGTYFTYSHIHRIALFGILGSVLGLRGYTQQGDDEFPEFYQELKGLGISIVPLHKNAYIPKKLQVYNNSVGYASQEQGGNLIIKEQWLENPSWRIYIADDGSSIFNKLKTNLLKKNSSYIPYLGKNDHYACIENVTELELTKLIDFESVQSFLKSDNVEFSRRGNVEFLGSNKSYFLEEYFPVDLKSGYNHYILEKLVFTNLKIKSVRENQVWTDEEFNIIFI